MNHIAGLGSEMADGWFVVYKMTPSVKERVAKASFGGDRTRWPRSTGQYIEISHLDAADYTIIETDLAYGDDWKEFDIWSKSCGSGSLEICEGGRNPFTVHPRSSALTEGLDFLGVTDAITTAELEAKEITLFILHEPDELEFDELLVELVDSANPLGCGIQEIDDFVNNFHNGDDPSAFVKLRDILGY